MARRRRFKPDPDFQQTISEAVVGGGVQRRVGSGSVRRRRTTLVDVAQNIIEEAQRITDSEIGLPSVQQGGRRAKGYDFRSQDRKGKTYRASFRYEIRREQGRLIVVVINDHAHAADVEFGTDGRGKIVPVRRDYLRLPITMAAYRRIKAKEKGLPRTPFDRERAAALAQVKYWEEKAKNTQPRFKALQQQARRLEKGSKTKLSEKQIIQRGLRLQEMKKEAPFKLAQAQRRLAVTEAGIREPHSFVTIGDDGRPYLFTKEVSTYRGYGILRQAMRRVTLQQLE